MRRHDDGARFECLPHGPGQEAQGDARPSSIERQEEAASPPALHEQDGVRRQAPHVRRLEPDAHEDHLSRVLELRPLAECLKESGQDHRRSVLGAGKGQEDVGAVAGPARRRHVHEEAHEGEHAGDATEAILRRDAVHDPAGKCNEAGVAGERKAEPMKEGAAPPGALPQDPEWALVQAVSSSKRSRILFSTAGSMSRT
jgi:hypothetical protein